MCKKHRHWDTERVHPRGKCFRSIPMNQSVSAGMGRGQWYPSAFLWLALAGGFYGFAASTREAMAQEREARCQAIESLATLALASESTAAWKTWQEEGQLTVLLRALDAGKLADPVAVKSCVQSMPAASTDKGRAAREAFAAWLATIESPVQPPIDSLQLPTLLPDDERLESAASLNRKLAVVTDDFRFGVVAESVWRERLRLTALEKLLAGQAIPAADVDAIETSWLLARSNWDNLAFRRVLAAVQRRLIWARRAQLEDGDRLVRVAVETLCDASKSAEHAEAAHFLDRLDMASAWTISWWSSRRHPQLQVRIHPPELESHKIKEVYRIRDVYAGTPVSGSGRFDGLLTIDWSDKQMLPTLKLRLEGEATSDTMGRKDGVTVKSNALASVKGGKTLEWSELGWSSLPALAQASARVHFRSIDPGPVSGRRRSATIGQVYASRPTAVRDTERAVERSSRARLNQQADKFLQPVNTWIKDYYRQPLLRQSRLAPRMVATQTDGVMTWDCWYGAPEEAGVANPPPPSPDAPWALAMHEDFLTRYLMMQYESAGSLGALSQLFGPYRSSEASAIADNDQAIAGEANRRTKLSPVDGCVVRVQDDLVMLTLRVVELESEQGVSSVPLEIQVAYRPQIEAGLLLWQRTNPPRIKILSGASTVRAQSLKRFVSRQSLSWFAEQAEWTPQLSTPAAESPFHTRVIHLRTENGWLVLSGEFSPKPAAENPQLAP